MYRIKISNLALTDLEIIRQFGILTFGYEQADIYEEGLKKEISTIQNMPSIGHRSKYLSNDYFIRPFKSHYIIFSFNEELKEIVIVRIVHQKIDLGEVEK